MLVYQRVDPIIIPIPIPGLRLFLGAFQCHHGLRARAGKRRLPCVAGAVLLDSKNVNRLIVDIS